MKSENQDRSEKKLKNQNNTQKRAVENKMNTKLEIMVTVSQVGTFGTESAVRKHGGSRNLPYLMRSHGKFRYWARMREQ